MAGLTNISKDGHQMAPLFVMLPESVNIVFDVTLGYLRTVNFDRRILCSSVISSSFS